MIKKRWYLKIPYWESFQSNEKSNLVDSNGALVVLVVGSFLTLFVPEQVVKINDARVPIIVTVFTTASVFLTVLFAASPIGT